MTIRCGTDSRLYREACVTGSVAETSCSWGETLLWGAVWLVMLVGLL